MCFEFLANFIECLVALRGYTFFTALVNDSCITSSESNVDLYLLRSSLLTVLRVVYICHYIIYNDNLKRLSFRGGRADFASNTRQKLNPSTIGHNIK